MEIARDIGCGIGCRFIIEIQYDHSEESGPLFDAMDVELEAIASGGGMAGASSNLGFQPSSE